MLPRIDRRWTRPRRPPSAPGEALIEHGRLAREARQRGLARRGTRDPVDRVLEHGRDRAVVLGRGDQEPVALAEELLEPLPGRRHAVLLLQVLVEERQREVAQVDDLDIGPGLARRPRRPAPAACCTNRSASIPPTARMRGGADGSVMGRTSHSEIPDDRFQFRPDSTGSRVASSARGSEHWECQCAGLRPGRRRAARRPRGPRS